MTNLTETFEFCLEKVENIMGRGENHGYHFFGFFSCNAFNVLDNTYQKDLRWCHPEN